MYDIERGGCRGLVLLKETASDYSLLSTHYNKRCREVAPLTGDGKPSELALFLALLEVGEVLPVQGDCKTPNPS